MAFAEPHNIQYMMDKLLWDVDECAAAYQMNVVIHSKSWPENLQLVLKKLREAGLTERVMVQGSS